MIKVLKEGKPHFVQFSCSYCGCEFAADGDDYIVETVTRFNLKRGFHRMKAFEAECPRCGCDVNTEKD